MAAPSSGTEPRPTLREAQRAVTRTRIVDALAALVADEHPFEVSMAAVAQRAGVSEPTLYRHFPTKRDLFAALATQQFTAMVQGLDTTSQAGLLAGIRTVYARTVESEDVIRWMLAAPDPERMPRPNVEARVAMLRQAVEGVDFDSADGQHLLRIMLLLSSPMAMLYWRDYLGLDPAAAAQTAAWALRALWQDALRQDSTEPDGRGHQAP